MKSVFQGLKQDGYYYNILKCGETTEILVLFIYILYTKENLILLPYSNQNQGIITLEIFSYKSSWVNIKTFYREYVL